MTTPGTNQFYLILENYDTTTPPVGIMITSGSAGSFVAPYYWKLDSSTKTITKETATSGDKVMSYFIKWSDLPDYTGTDSKVSAKYGSRPASRKYVIIPDKDIYAARVYISKTALDSSKTIWQNWKVNTGGDIPPFAADNSFLSSEFIVDKMEFTYASKSLSINTTTVDFLSIPMTVEASFNVAATWGSERGPMGITDSLKTVAAAFTSLGKSNGVDWSKLNSTKNSTTYRILSPFRYLDGSPSDASSWNSYFDDYLEGLITQYSTGISYPINSTKQGMGYFIAKVKVSGGKWVVDAYGKDGTTSAKKDICTIDPATYKGNSKDVFAVTNSNDLAWDILAGINRGIAHLSDNHKGWADIFNTYFPATTASPTGQWTSSDWTNSASYYPTGKLTSGQTIVSNQYSKLLHDNSIVGSASNRTASPLPTAVNAQNYCYGFSVDDIWLHGSIIYGQGVDGNGNGTTISATIGIFEQG